MKFPFFNRFSENKEPDWVVTRDSVPLSTLARWYIYDMGIEEPNKFGGKVFNLNPISSEGKEKEEKSLNEALSPEAFERMDALTSNTAQTAMIRAAEIMMSQLTKEGFEVLDIREYFTQLIANDI
jgi:hypothetical protein